MFATAVSIPALLARPTHAKGKFAGWLRFCFTLRTIARRRHQGGRF